MVNGSLSGLPCYLIKERAGINNGFMIPQYTAAALASENKVLCHPSSVDSITTSSEQEDHVSMGGYIFHELLITFTKNSLIIKGFSTRKALSIVRNIEYIADI